MEGFKAISVEARGYCHDLAIRGIGTEVCRRDYGRFTVTTTWKRGKLVAARMAPVISAEA